MRAESNFFGRWTANLPCKSTAVKDIDFPSDRFPNPQQLPSVRQWGCRAIVGLYQPIYTRDGLTGLLAALHLVSFNIAKKMKMQGCLSSEVTSTAWIFAPTESAHFSIISWTVDLEKICRPVHIVVNINELYVAAEHMISTTTCVQLDCKQQQ